MRSMRRLLCSNATAHLEMGTVIDRYVPTGRTWLMGYSNFAVSTRGIIMLRRELEGWGVPRFKQEAADIYTGVGKALAAADEAALKKLTTASCFAQMLPSLRARPAGQRHAWETLSCTATVVQVRIGHHKSNAERRFAQVTCGIDAQVVYTMQDKKTGAVVGGLGSAAEPYHEKNVWWVFERCISQPVEPPAWRLKEQIRPPAEDVQEGT